MQSINKIYEGAVKTFINDSGNSNIIKAKDFDNIEQKLIDQINGQIDSMGEHKKHVQSLPSYAIALVVSELYVVRNVSSTGGRRDRSSLLAIYQQEGSDEGLYVSDNKTIENYIRRFNRSIRCNEIKEVKAILADMAPTVSVTTDRDLIPVNNGIFNYKSKDLMSFSPDYVFLAKSDVDYVPGAVNQVIPNADNTLWDVESWMTELSDDKEIVALLWQIIGAALRPNVSWDKAVIFYNETGNNGKGSLCELIRNICGKDRCSSLAIADFSHEFKLDGLTSAMVVIADENDTRSFTENVSQFKAIVTGDSVTINRKYNDPIDIRFRGLIIQCMNDLPKMGDKTDSLYRRLLTVPFAKCFTGTERKYIKHDYLQRKEVLEYVLYKVLNMNYYTLDEPVACKRLLEELKTGNDNIRQFLEEILPQLTWSLVPWEFLYGLYQRWTQKYNPRAKVEGKMTFQRDVKTIIHDYPGWDVTTSPMHSNVIVNVPEPLIAEYAMWSWGTSATPNPGSLKASYRGLRRV